MYYIRYPLSFRQVEDILHERGVDICHETVRFWALSEKTAWDGWGYFVTSSNDKTLSIHASVQNHFNQERHLYSRINFKLNRAAAIAEWRQLLSA